MCFKKSVVSVGVVDVELFSTAIYGFIDRAGDERFNHDDTLSRRFQVILPALSSYRLSYFIVSIPPSNFFACTLARSPKRSDNFPISSARRSRRKSRFRMQRGGGARPRKATATRFLARFYMRLFSLSGDRSSRSLAKRARGG